MKKIRNILLAVMVAACALIVAACSSGNEKKESQATGELSGEIVMWHSFTQGPRLESIQKSADDFMKAHPKVKIKIETLWSLDMVLSERVISVQS